MANAPASARADQALEVRKFIRGSREAVFRAWTLSTSWKHWFSSPEGPVRKAKIEAKPGGAILVECDYRGGTWTLRGVFRELDAPRRLAFTWESDDIPAEVGSVVTVDFHEKSGGTEIVLTQSGFPGEKKRAENEGGWTELMGHLGELIVAQPALRAEARRTVRAAPEAVWRAWTTPALMAKMMSPEPERGRVTADVRVGGRFEIIMVMDGKEYFHEGEYLEVDPPRRLKFTWWSEWSPRDLNPTVTVDFIPKDGGTEVVVVHEGQLDEPSRADHEAGWGEIAAAAEMPGLVAAK